jgi:hypothetical protein
MNTRGRNEAAIVRRQLQSPLGAGPRFSDDYDARDSRRPCAIEHISAIRIVCGIGEVAVGVY